MRNRLRHHSPGQQESHDGRQYLERSFSIHTHMCHIVGIVLSIVK
jgi:hypothetical protein